MALVVSVDVEDLDLVDGHVVAFDHESELVGAKQHVDTGQVRFVLDVVDGLCDQRDSMRGAFVVDLASPATLFGAGFPLKRQETGRPNEL